MKVPKKKTQFSIFKKKFDVCKTRRKIAGSMLIFIRVSYSRIYECKIEALVVLKLSGLVGSRDDNAGTFSFFD
jgi:hypothetical protein